MHFDPPRPKGKARIRVGFDRDLIGQGIIVLMLLVGGKGGVVRSAFPGGSCADLGSAAEDRSLGCQHVFFWDSTDLK